MSALQPESAATNVDGLAGMSAIILGATGAVGKPLLKELLASQTFTTVHEFGRKPSPGISDAKLKQHTIDFEVLLKEDTDGGDGEQAKSLREVGADVVFITLGTTRAAAGGAKPFEKIDREYVLAAARAAFSSDKTSQRVVYCSSQMASSQSKLLYPQSKGLTEEGLAAAGYSDVLLFRPGFLAQAERPETRAAEKIYGWFTSNVLSRFTANAEIQTATLGRAMRSAGEKGTAALLTLGVGAPPQDSFRRPEGKAPTVTVIGNAEAKSLAEKAA